MTLLEHDNTKGAAGEGGKRFEERASREDRVKREPRRARASRRVASRRVGGTVGGCQADELISAAARCLFVACVCACMHATLQYIYCIAS